MGEVKKSVKPPARRVSSACVLRSHMLLVLILAIYLAGGVIHATNAPLLDVSDEPRHYAYIEHLANGGALPVQRQNQTEAEAPWHQEGSQPPLYYVLMAAVAQPFDRSDYAAVWRFNPHARLGRADTTHNWNQMLHGDAERFPWRGTMLAMMVMRLISMLFGAVAVVCTYAISRTVRPDSTALAAFAAALTAFNPMFLHIMASVNNDTLASAMSSLSLLLGARLIRGDSPRTALLLGVTLGCAALSKASGLALAASVPLAILAADWLRQRSLASATRLAMSMAIPATAIAGWFYIRNAILYGEITGTQMMAAIAGPRVPSASLSTLASEWLSFLSAYIGMFGAVNIPMAWWMYYAYGALCILGTAGLLLATTRWRQAQQNDPQGMIILCMCVAAAAVAGIALLRWTSMTLASQGRLLFPIVAALSLLLALGLRQLGKALPVFHSASALKRGLAGVLCSALATLTLASPYAYIRPAYNEPQRLSSEADLPPDLARTEVFFEDKIRWIGYRVQTPGQRVRPGDIIDITMYFQGLRTLDLDYSLFIKLFARGVEIVGIDTYPGGGMYQATRWKPGEILVDHYRLRIPDTLTNTALLPATLKLDLGVYDFARGTREGQLRVLNGDGALVSRPQYEAASLNIAQPARAQPALYSLDQARVLSARAQPVAPGAIMLPFEIVWQATADFTADYTVFVQLFDAAGQPVGQGDSRAMRGEFSSQWWRAGDVITDSHSIALTAPLAPGAYTIKYGLYRNTGAQERMAVKDASDQPMPDAAMTYAFEVP